VASLEIGPPIKAQQVEERAPHTGAPAEMSKASHAALLTTAQLCRGVVRMLFVVVVARHLGPKAFGIYALLLATIEMLAVVSGSSYIDYLTREAATDRHLGWGLASQLVVLRSILTLPLVGVGLGILFLLHYPVAVVVSAAWFSTTLLFRNVSEAVQGVLRGTGHYVAFLFIEISIGLGLALGAGWLLFRGGGLTVVVGTEIVAAAMGATLAVLLTMKLRPTYRVHARLRGLLRSSAIFNLYGFVGNLFDRVDVLILSKLAGDYATGIYSAAYRPLGAVQLLPYGILYSLLPALSRTNSGGKEREKLEKVLGFLLSAALFIILATMVFADSVVPRVLGPHFSETATALKILIWAVAPRYINYGLNMALLAIRKEHIFVRTSLVCLSANVVGNLLLVPRFGWRAAAVLTIVTEALLLGQNAFWLQRLLGSVPKPIAWFRNLLAFLILLGAALVGQELGFPVATGTICIVVFLTYLLQSGMIREFASARTRQECVGSRT
jgi:O-antigen/teichoic acid export membrane protein